MIDLKVLSSEVVFKNPFFSVVLDKFIHPAIGKESQYWVVKKSPSVFVLAETDDNKYIFVKQFRYPTKLWSLEVPAGATDYQDPVEAAKRELWEETGFKAENWELLGKFQVSPGMSANVAEIWKATGLTQSGNNKQDEEGITECVALSLEEIKEKVESGEITDGCTLAVFGKMFLS